MSRRIVKPKTQSGKHFLQKREPKLHENDKQCMLIKGGNTSEIVSNVLKELHTLKQPNAILFKKKNVTRPFEDSSSLEFFSSRSDASLFAFGSHSRKRPNNLVIGRLYNGSILDMVEFGIDKFISLSQLKGKKFYTGGKSVLVFIGEQFEQTLVYQRIKNLLIDFFRGSVVKNICLSGIEHVICVTAVNERFYIRNYRICIKREEGAACREAPTVELLDIGMSLDLSLRRTKLASHDLFKKALKQPKAAQVKKVKNISHDAFGTKTGLVHMTKQDLSRLPDRKMKKLKRKSNNTSASLFDKTKTPSESHDDGGTPKKIKQQQQLC